ncbi:MAG: SCO family protein, partial [Solirubrobacterales bacterium]|nr:SCO family protein [Solirubrobacterales bacterium]
FSWSGHAAGPEYRLLSAVPVQAGGDGLSVAALAAVRRLAAGAHLAPAPVYRPAARAASASNGWILVVVIAVLAVLSALSAVLWRARHASAAPAPRSRRPVVRRQLPRAALLALAGCVVACTAVAAVIVASAIRGGARDSSLVTASSAAPSPRQAASLVTPPPFSWSPGQRPAPDFSLVDQSGGRVSLRSYRGHPVIVTFIDPVCRNLCPLQAKVLDQAVREMPVSRRPAILAVSVDVYADTRADLLRDFRKWELVRQWRWAVGSRARLTAVWRSYKIAVAVSRVKVRGTTITSITHTSAAYIVDRTGHERALFLWPFYPQDVVHVLRQLPS